MGKHKGGKGGTIVNIASIVSLEPYRICPVYCGTKYNVLGFSQSMQVIEKAKLKTPDLEKLFTDSKSQGQFSNSKNNVTITIDSLIAVMAKRILFYKKLALWKLTFSLLYTQGRFEKTGVRVLVMCPGITTTALIADTKPKTLDFVEPQEVSAVMSVPQQP